MTENHKKNRNGLAIIGGTLINGKGKEPIEDSLILIEGNLFMAVGKKEHLKVPDNFDVINITGKSVLPGMMDLHVHFGLGEDDVLAIGHSLPPFLDKTLPFLSIRGFAFARRAFEMGFTTLRGCGDMGWLDISLRDIINMGLVEGPRISATGQFLSRTGGYWDVMPPWLRRYDFDNYILADGVDGVRVAVREKAKMKADWVKICAGGGVASLNRKTREYTRAELDALVEEAHANNLMVAAHCFKEKDTLEAVSAGIDSVEHGVILSDAIIEVMLKNGTFLVPTFSAPFNIVNHGSEFNFPEALIEGSRSVLDTHVSSFTKALDAGVKVALGTDAGMTSVVHGTNALELELLVKFGMTPMQAIIAATRDGALLLRQEDKLGTIEKGKLADLVIVDGNPLDDIAILREKEKIIFVIKDGIIHINRVNEANFQHKSS